MEIAIISGKGGTGKSSVSAAFATLSKGVVLADCDVDAANLYLLFNPENEEEEIYNGGQKASINYDKCTNCGICTSYCRFDAIYFKGDLVTINSINCDGCVLCSRVCPEKAITMIPNDDSRMLTGSFRNGKMVYGRLAPGEENSGKLVNMVRDKAKKLSFENNLDTIILDGPPGTGCPVISTITGADKIIVVTEPTISGFNDMIRVLEVIKKFSTKPYVIINKHDLNRTMSEKIQQWCVENNITVAGYLPFSTEMVNAMVEGKSITEFDPEHIISKKLAVIWQEILDESD